MRTLEELLKYRAWVWSLPDDMRDKLEDLRREAENEKQYSTGGEEN